MVAWRAHTFLGTAYPGVSLKPVQPIVMARALFALSDPQLPKAPDGSPGYRIVSGARSYALQKRMYDEWKAGIRKVPAVANPDRVRSDGRVGSNHMVQPGTVGAIQLADGDMYHRAHLSHALDITPHRIERSTANWKALEERMNYWGLYLTVGVAARSETGMATAKTRSFEPWHFEINPRWAPPNDLFEMVYIGRRVELIPTVADGISHDDPLRWIKLRDRFRIVMKVPERVGQPWGPVDRRLLVAAEIFLR